ncbi:hypothetical protein CspeluHIS016_0900230 [Cutaneotrichosporon spelunceum]|uniref:Uncharacterized protein n=1 Tax=Cutaneotrichosporon spelunceum TaxID=1672016 RepID=A0AAD3U084_9TREE|nr:hypothetical protein CspeluHIS016_0900230 [Cutaneotrichosporon spelunceum]
MATEIPRRPQLAHGLECWQTGHLPTISEESRNTSSRASPHNTTRRRQSKPDWPWDSGDEEYIENAPPKADAHACLGWEIQEYSERQLLGEASSSTDDDIGLFVAPNVNLKTPTILVTPPPATRILMRFPRPKGIVVRM